MPERKISYDKLQHKAETGLHVKAPSLQRLFIDTALALTDMLASLDTIEDKEHRKISVSANDHKLLMLNWLNSILSLFHKEKFLCHRIVFESFDGKKIQATLSGETHVPTKHGALSEIQEASPDQFQLGDSETPEPHFFVKVFLKYGPTK